MSSDANTVLEALAQCHPELMGTLGRLRHEWAPEDPPLTVALGDLGLALVRAIRATTDEQLRRVALVVEEALQSNSESNKDAIATGFLEAVMAGSDTEPDAVRLTKLLGPLAREYCRAWDKFTGCRTPGVWD